jgi:tetratricopeptide (TPR) repeat protein
MKLSQTSQPPCGAVARKGPGRPRVGRARFLTVLAVAMMGIVALGVYWFARSRQIQARTAAATAAGLPPATGQNTAKAPVAGRAGSVAPDQAETRTPLVLLRAGKEGAARPVVALGRPVGGKNKRDTQGTIQSILERELIRQAILIAARDELGLPTRDEILDDAPPGPGQGDGPPVEIAILFRPAECHALVRRGADGNAETLQKHDLGTNPDAGNFSALLTATAETLSRTEFPALLKQLGAQGEPNTLRDDASVPPDVDRRLETLSMVETLAAVRTLHEAIRVDGESLARLSALARAYAQLGMLTEDQWNPAHRVFKARALLYAQRLYARPANSGSAHALRTRAFVRALVGRHDLALSDLDQANKLDEAAKAKGAPPSPSPTWLPAIDAYLKADRQRLAIKDGPYARLASLLNVMVLEFPPGTRLVIQAARDVIQTDADCDRAYGAIFHNGDLGDLHAATAMGPVAFTKAFPDKLKSLTTLPESVKTPLDQGGDELTLVGRLEEAGRPGQDAGEPSWGVLAHLVRETQFVQVWRRLFFMARKWNVPVDDYFNEVRPLVAKHRYLPYLESYTASRQDGGRALNAFADRLDLTDIELTARPLINDLLRLKHPAGDMAWRLSVAHGSILARDFAVRIRQTPDKTAHFGRVLLTISPYSAYAMSILIQADWNRVQGEIPSWRAKVGDAPGLIGALGKKYAELKQYDEAEKYLKRYVELSGDEWAYQELAACYEARGDRDRAKATLDNYLNKTESAGLRHAQVQVEIANKLMKQGRWKDAQAYAESAAETWAAFGMECASVCAEGLKDWDRAELWIRRVSERYPRNGWPRWYLFCKRTGHGDLQSARALVEAHLTEIEGASDPEETTKIGFFHWSVGSPKKALDFIEKAFQAEPSALRGIACGLLADELNDKARRNRMLEQVIALFQGKNPRMVTLCKMIHDTLVNGGRPPLDLAAVDKVLDRMPAKNRVNADFLVGRYLLNRRQPDAARKYLKRCADSGEVHVWSQVLAIDALRSLDSQKK